MPTNKNKSYLEMNYDEKVEACKLYSLERIREALARAMAKAGVFDTSLTIQPHTEMSSYGDYVGYAVCSSSQEMTNRAVKWLTAWLKKIPVKDLFHQGIHDRGECSKGIFVCTSYHSLGD